MQKERKKPEKYKRLFSDTFLFGISSFGSRFLLLLLTPLYTSLLTEAEYGTADLIQTTINFIYPIFTLAIADAAMRFAMEKTCRKEAVLGNAMMFTILASLLLALCYPLISTCYAALASYFGIFLLIFTLFNLHNALACFLKGIGMRRLFALQGFVQTVTIIACNLLFLLKFGWRLEGYLYSIAIGYAVPILLMFLAGQLWQYWPPPFIDRTLLKAMLHYSLPLIPALLAWEVNNHIDRYMIIGTLDLSANGLYSVAHKIPSILTAVLSIFLQAWQLSAIESHGEQDSSNYHTEVYSALEAISLIVCLLLIALTKPIAHLLFSGDFFPAWQYVPMLLISALFSALSGFLAAAFRAEKKTAGLLVSVLIGAAINILLNAILLPRMGLQGAAIATAISFFCVWLIRLLSIQKLVKIRIPILRTVLAYLFFAAGVILVILDLPYALPAFALTALFILLLRAKEWIMLFRAVKRLINRKL